MKASSNYYKKTLHAELTAYKNKNVREIRKIRKSDPKIYWKFLNGNKNTQATTRFEDVFEHFRNVNRGSDNEELGAALNENYVQHENNTEINGPITLDENKAVRRLKNNKSSGIDMVLNEHNKMS